MFWRLYATNRVWPQAPQCAIYWKWQGGGSLFFHRSAVYGRAAGEAAVSLFRYFGYIICDHQTARGLRKRHDDALAIGSDVETVGDEVLRGGN